MQKTFTPDSKYVNSVSPAFNFNKRKKQIDILLYHYTAMKNANKALQWLCCKQSKVSCHYFIFKDGRIIQLVPEKLRAYHAGLSYWRGKGDINSSSIGIEIDNDGTEHFTKKQMRSLVKLSKDIIKRHKILPQNILAHSDVAPLRKQDPGKFFNWQWLAKQNIGHFVKAVSMKNEKKYKRGQKNNAIKKCQMLLSLYGYECKANGYFSKQTQAVVKAFQRHHRQAKIDGVLDFSTRQTLENLCAALDISWQKN